MKQFIIKLLVPFAIFVCISTTTYADIWNYAENTTVDVYEWGLHIPAKTTQAFRA